MSTPAFQIAWDPSPRTDAKLVPGDLAPAGVPKGTPAAVGISPRTLTYVIASGRRLTTAGCAAVLAQARTYLTPAKRILWSQQLTEGGVPLTGPLSPTEPVTGEEAGWWAVCQADVDAQWTALHQILTTHVVARDF